MASDNEGKYAANPLLSNIISMIDNCLGISLVLYILEISSNFATISLILMCEKRESIMLSKSLFCGDNLSPFTSGEFCLISNGLSILSVLLEGVFIGTVGGLTSCAWVTRTSSSRSLISKVSCISNVSEELLSFDPTSKFSKNSLIPFGGSSLDEFSGRV